MSPRCSAAGFQGLVWAVAGERVSGAAYLGAGSAFVALFPATCMQALGLVSNPAECLEPVHQPSKRIKRFCCVR